MTPTGRRPADAPRPTKTLAGSDGAPASRCPPTSRRGRPSSPSCTSPARPRCSSPRQRLRRRPRRARRDRAGRPRRVPRRAAVRPLGPRHPLRPRARPALPRRRNAQAAAGDGRRSPTWLGDLRQLPREPTKALAALDLLVQKNVMADPEQRPRAVILIDHAGYVAPSGDDWRSTSRPTW